MKSLDRWNWSHNIEFTAKKLVEPTSVEDLQAVVKDARGQVKVVGSAHSFNDIADTDGTHVKLSNFMDITMDADKPIGH